MRLPTESAHYSQRVRFGRYVVRRLRRAQYTAFSTDAEAATNAVLSLGRAYEDENGPVQDAMADRDGADDALDTSAQNARAALAGRSGDSVKKAPYTLIFPSGIGYYTAAPVDEEVKRYGELRGRLDEHLPANDEIRAKTVADIEQNLDAYKKAAAALDQARTNESLAKTRLEAAEEDWARLMTKIYGALLGELGRAEADKFFPKQKNGGKKPDEKEG